MKKGGRLTYLIASAIQIGFAVISLILIFVASAALGIVASDASAVIGVVTIITVVIYLIFLVPTLLIVIFGSQKNNQKHFAAAVIAIVIGGLGLIFSWFNGLPVYMGVLSFGISVAQLVGGILYIVGKN